MNTNRLILFGETVAVCCGNHKKHKNSLMAESRFCGMLKHLVHASIGNIGLKGDKNYKISFHFEYCGVI
jgi:hypothetical protein